MRDTSRRNTSLMTSRPRPHGCLDAVWELGAGKLLCCKEEEAGIGVRVQEAAQMFLPWAPDGPAAAPRRAWRRLARNFSSDRISSGGACVRSAGGRGRAGSVRAACGVAELLQWTCACGGSGLLAVRRRSQSPSAPAAGVMSRAAISWSGGTGGRGGERAPGLIPPAAAGGLPLFHRSWV